MRLDVVVVTLVDLVLEQVLLVDSVQKFQDVHLFHEEVLVR